MKKLLAGLMVCLCLLAGLPMMPERTYAKANYSNAKTFYDSTGGVETNGKHIECDNGMVYFATKAKAASSSTALKYTSIGFDVTLTGAGYTLTFAVKRGGSLTEIVEAKVSEEYNYRMYCITTEDLHALASKVNKTAADAIFAADTFDVRMDAIMTTKQNDVDHGAIKENGDGTITVVRNPVYHLNKTSDLNELKKAFNNEFKGFIDITARLTNYNTTIYYSVGEGVTMANGYSAQSYTLSGTTISNVLYKGNKAYTENYKTLQRFYLLDTENTGLNLKKTGYHLGDGEGGSVWKKSSGEAFSITKDYGPKNLSDKAGTKKTTVFLYANWQPNTYTIIYDSDGGAGVVNPTAMVYNQTGYLKENTYKKDGYYIDPAKAWIDANGKTYANNQQVINLTSTHKDEITLKANWQPVIAEITLNKQGGSRGTDFYYQKYGIGFYTANTCEELLDQIIAPLKKGYDFKGYYTSFNGMGGLVVNEAGKYQQDNTYFKNSATVYAYWEAQTYPVTFDKQGGRYGSDSVTATYGKLYPVADAPERPGYRFNGYYTQPYGAGTEIYNEFMSSTQLYHLAEGITLYAYWVDDILPVINLTVTNDKWTNSQVTLTAEASDFGSGLASVHTYRLDGDGTEIPVASVLNLKGATTKDLSFTNTKEGIVRYKAVAIDKDGNTAESYNVVYYDTQAPTGTVVDKLVEDNKFYFEIDITDINTGN